MSKFSNIKANEKWLKKKKAKAQYWQVKLFLDGLRLKYSEQEKGTPQYFIVVPLFGMKFRFDDIEQPSDAGWDVFYLDTVRLDKEPDYFKEEVMWLLVERGYFAYIRDVEVGGRGRIFRSLLIDAGWGQKIIKKRIELCSNEPRHTFMRIRMSEFLHVPMPKIISYYPGFFDYLF